MATAALMQRVRATRARELELAQKERDLAVSKAAVIATVSHEFRTPLTIINGVARTLELQEMIALAGCGKTPRRFRAFAICVRHPSVI